MKVNYYAACSIDGCIAKDDGDVSWLEELGISMEETGYNEFYSTVDGLVMGRSTYEMIVGFGEWPYGGKPIWVCSSREVLPALGCNLQTGNTPELAYQSAVELQVQHLWLVGGGSLASSFLERNLLTHISLSIMPIVLGGGIRLFGDAPLPTGLVAERHRFHKSGMVQIDYAIGNA